MSRTRAYTEESIAVTTRFFAVIDALVAMGKIRGNQTYCKRYGIDPGNFRAQKKDLNKGFFQVSWIIPLIRDFNVSSDWILLGKGKMFTEGTD